MNRKPPKEAYQLVLARYWLSERRPVMVSCASYNAWENEAAASSPPVMLKYCS